MIETTERNFYLNDIPMTVAQQRLQDALRQADKHHPLEAERVGLRHANGRILAEAVWARRSSPHFHASAMDGYAVFASDTIGATETSSKSLTLPEQAIPVNTGSPLPTGKNAVVMIEHVQQVDALTISITQAVVPFQHVRLMGEDIVETELVLPASHRIRPVDLGAIAGCGHHEVWVRRRPHVILIPTGSELVKADQNPHEGQLIEFNSLILSAQIEEAGGIASVMDIIPDEPDSLMDALQTATDQQPHLILILSGSSAGSKDFTSSVIGQLGTVLVHGVAVRPGHPVIMGMAKHIPIIGVPGYPVSATLTAEIFILPLLHQWLGLHPTVYATLPSLVATLTQKLNSPIGDDDFVRVSLAKIGDTFLATPISKGAGAITSLVRADGIAHVPRLTEGVEAGGTISVRLYRPLSEIENAVVLMGSHDPMLDLLGQFLLLEHGIRLTSSNVGSLGGLIALRRNHAHGAGTHLLDPVTGDFNIPYVKQYLAGQSILLVTFAEREQGLLVQRGNPLGITSIADLTRVKFINRQRGAGTRILLDDTLKKLEIAPSQIQGYTHEEFTHLGVAAAVSSGIGDCGLAIRQAAVALGLDFVSVGWERYEIAIPLPHQSHPGIQAILTQLSNTAFLSALANQAGYRTDLSGQQRLIHESGMLTA